MLWCSCAHLCNPPLPPPSRPLPICAQAARVMHGGVLRALLAAGADPCATDGAQKTPLAIMLEACKDAVSCQVN